MLKVRGLNKNVIIGGASLIILITLIIIIAQTGGNRNTSSPPLTTNPFEIPHVSAEALKNKLDAGSNLVIVDTRSKGEYEQVHIAGAVSIPLAEIAERSAELKGYDEIVTYCT